MGESFSCPVQTCRPYRLVGLKSWYFRTYDHAAIARRRHRGDRPGRSPPPEAPTTQGQDRKIGGLARPRHRPLLYSEAFAPSVTLKRRAARAIELLPSPPHPNVAGLAFGTATLTTT